VTLGSIGAALEAQLAAAVPGVSVRLGPPSEPLGNEVELSVWLYEVVEDQQARNLNVGRGDDPVRLELLHIRARYLIAASSSDPRAAHDALGRAALALRDHPVLELSEEGGLAPGIPVRLTAVTMPLDTLAALWTTLGLPLQPVLTCECTTTLR
jgi:hypothetical protein